MVSEKRKFGNIGEAVAEKFLAGRGFTVIARNYLKPFGEIDIIAKKQGKYHFVEVKTVSREIQEGSVSRVTDEYNPMENVHPKKLARLHRTIETYLMENNVSHETPWQLDVITVQLDLNNKKAKVDHLENIV